MDFLAEGFRQALVLLFSLEPETYSAVMATLKASSLSMVTSLLIGLPLGFALGHNDFKIKRSVRTALDTLLALPTVVIGLLVYAFITRHGPLGGLGLLFSIQGIAVGQTILALPIIIALTATAVESQDERLKTTLLTLGADKKLMIKTVLWESRFAILVAAMAAYGRVASEVGISMMVGGNIKWHTRTITTAIALETGKGEFANGIALGMVLMVIALGVNLALSRLRRRAGQ